MIFEHFRRAFVYDRDVCGARSEKGQATVVGAGHPPLIVMRGQPTGIDRVCGAALGCRGSRFGDDIQLQPGDGAFTDGLYASSRRTPGGAGRRSEWRRSCA
jgi:hypothetical protein